MSSDLREAWRAFTTTVALITTNGRKGPNVMAAEWTFHVSYEPFIISVHVAPENATYEVIEASKEFGVNLVSEEQAAAMAFAGHFSQSGYGQTIGRLVRDLSREEDQDAYDPRGAS